MNDGIRLERNRFRPDQGLAAEVVRLEERVVLNSSFKMPPALVGLLPGQSGNLIMTSRAYGAAQSMVIKAFDNFAGTMAKIQKQYGANYLSDPAAIAKIGLGGAGTYGANTALGRLDTALRTAGAKFPYGRGVATDPVNAAQLGTGLSIRSAAVSPNFGNCSNKSRKYAHGSIRFRLHVWITPISTATGLPPVLLATNSLFLRPIAHEFIARSGALFLQKNFRIFADGIFV